MANGLSAAARAFLDEVRFVVLATVLPGGAPQQTVMWYILDGDEIVFNTKRGRLKDKNLGRDPRVSLCIADGYRYVTIRGPVTIVEDPATAQADIRRIAIRYSGPEKGAARAVSQFSKEERISYRVKLDQVLVYGFDE